LTEFQSAISDSILESKLREIENSPVYSIVEDESIDTGNRKRLIMYAQYFFEKEIKVCLLNNVEIKRTSANAEVLTNKILDELKSKGLYWYWNRWSKCDDW
jgi:polynucleotide 5'-kinase involved in rRNA processing